MTNKALKAKRDLYRIIDANLNRSREGLRVCEEMTRFVLNSKALTRELKAVRHSIYGVSRSGGAGSKDLALSRDPEGDCLRQSRFKSEMKRRTFADIFAANIERVKESLRVLEELYKLADVKSSVKFCGLRFKVYAIEKKVMKRLG
ncbi:MAG: thiamine-phosphate pyrophosphorylase [Candidatus Omnitrophica bacterium]|nr:thiamine-phosphate pyrophosphorylase [Candidatus Omnitrophota bacterium]